jgi:hypothetical protein
MRKETAIEWLIGELNGYDEDCEIFQKAKAMERWQIEQAYDRGHHDCFHGRHGKHKEYYNETYKGGEQ